uniref:BHLH domain-containing protein n=1 Tax=Panagrolaimus sp. ES5 TaxID=591445 RepID=A0AC34F1G0_9BILA
METEEFQKLGAVLPISRAISEQHIDKTTIVRLAASYIRLHHLLGFRQHPHFPQQQQNGVINFGVAGFENEDLITPCLIDFLKATLYTKESNTETFRVKSTLTKRSSKDLHNPNAGFRPLQITITPCSTSVSTGNFYVAGYCQPHLVGPGITIRLNNENFVITTDLTFNIIYIDPHVTKFFNLKQQNYTTSSSNSAAASSSELNENWKKGVSFYSIIFPEDVYIAQEMHQNLFKFHSYKSPLIQLISNDNYSTFNVEIFAISYSSVNAHGNSQKITGEHFVFICTYIG